MSLSLLCSSLLVQRRWRNSLVCLWTFTDAPWGAQGRSVCSSPVLLAAPFFDGGSHCQGCWIAVSNVPWIHVSTWMQASLQHKANKSVGHVCWTIRWLPPVVPGSLFETCFCKVGIIGAPLSDNIVAFGKTGVLETLTYKVELCRTIFCERKEVLGLKSCLIRRNISGNIQVAMLCTEHIAFQKTLMSEVYLVRIVTFKAYFNILWSFFKGIFDSMGLLQVLFNQLIWYAIGAKRSPASTPGRLVCCLSLC
jgi:hypothetical protein